MAISSVRDPTNWRWTLVCKLAWLLAAKVSVLAVLYWCCFSERERVQVSVATLDSRFAITASAAAPPRGSRRQDQTREISR